MGELDARLAAARELVEGVLRGTVTEEEAPWLFEEDRLLFAARTLEAKDRPWLERALHTEGTTLEGRRAVISCLDLTGWPNFRELIK